MKIIIEYDNSKLKKLCDKLQELFTNNGYTVMLLDNNITLNNKINYLKNNNSFLLSNRINNNNKNAIEIIYPLRDNNKLAIILNDNISKIITVSKYYQLRLPSITNLDYYEILRDYNNQAIMIKYGENTLNIDNLASIVYQSINNYLNNSNIYIVKSGDSLYAIAKKFNTTVDEIKRINNLTSNLLSINQKLIIPSKNEVTNSDNIYIVKSGDSLYAIAKKFNTTVDEIKRINNLTSNLLSIDQKLIIPNNEVITYIVQKGDSLYAIAKKYNTTVDEIKRLNNLTSNLLSINQKLIIKK